MKAALGFSLVLAVAACWVLLAQPIEALNQGDGQALAHWIRAQGTWGVLGSVLLYILQALAAPIPAFALSLANGLVYGPLWGGLLSWVGGVVSAVVCFEVSRYLGRPFAVRKLGPVRMAQLDLWAQKGGFWAVLIFRLTPFLPFDPLTWALGVSGMSRARFFAANLLGQLPASFLYARLGASVSSHWPWLLLLAILPILALFYRKPQGEA